MRGRGRRRLVRGRLLRGWVRGFLTFAIVEEARVYVNQAGKEIWECKERGFFLVKKPLVLFFL